MDSGTLLALGDIETLRTSVSKGLTVALKSDGLPGDMQVTKLPNGFYAMQAADEQEIPGIVERIVANGNKVYHISAQHLTLEEIYFALIEQKKPQEVHHD